MSGHVGESVGGLVGAQVGGPVSKTYVLTYLSTKRLTSQPKRPTYLPYEESNNKPTKSNQEPTNSYQTCARPTRPT